MNVRLTFIIFVIFFLNFLLRAETNKKIQLSPTFSFTIKKSDIKILDLVSLNSKWFQFTSPKTDMPLTLLVLKESPETIANKYSVERYWSQVRARTKLIDKKEENFGCRALSTRSYTCSRNVAQNGKFFSEAIYWNLKNDLILFRSSSNSSFEEAKQVLDNLKINMVSRLPAGIKK